MADKFYSLVPGEQSVHEVTEGSSTSSEVIELRVNDTVTDPLVVIQALEILEQFFATRETNPIA